MKAVILLSYGIDSPVAAYLMQEKVLELIGVNFFTTDHKDIEIIAKKIGIKKVHYIDHKNILSQIKNNTHPKYTCILCKRMMYRIAEKIAEKENAKFIVTGENLGQVASQTLDNLAVLEEAVEIPVLRPLLCLDKEEIVSIAKEIETYNLAKNIKCPFVPTRPVTKADLIKTKQQETKINIKKLI